MSNKLSALIGAGVGLILAIVSLTKGVQIGLVLPIIGAVVGYFIAKARNDKLAIKLAAKLEEEKKQRIHWAGKLKKMVAGVANNCEKNADEYEDLLNPRLKADAQMENILKELANATELMGIVESMARDTKTKGGE